MRIREVLRLYFAAALSIRAIAARSLGTSPSTVGDYLRRAKVAGLSWPLPESVDDARLERRLFPVSPPSRTARPLPDWSEVHRELRRKNVTLSLLWWAGVQGDPPGGVAVQPVLRAVPGLGREARLGARSTAPARKLFVDYAGQTVPVGRPGRTGEVRMASHVRAFEFYGGCTELVVPDNLRSGVSRAIATSRT